MKYNIKINLSAESLTRKPNLENIPFGRVFSDHLFSADYKDGEWTNLEIKPFEKMLMSPANATLHYGQSIFEGMKVFKDTNGTPIIFRGEQHARRLNASAVRMAMPELPEDLFMQALEQLIQVDMAWIPDAPDSSLYIRPFMYSADEFIGVQPGQSYKFIIFTCPVGSYYGKPVKLMTTDQFIRAARGGVGAAKTAGNYAASLLPAKIAKEQGYDQIMWLDGVERKYIQECGTMNLFFIIDGTVITPSIAEDTILKGITRDSFIALLKDDGYTVEERQITIDEVIAAYDNGTLQEAFGSGTAAVVAHVDEIKHGDKVMVLPKERPISANLKVRLNEVRKGITEDKFGWVKRVTLPEIINA